MDQMITQFVEKLVFSPSYQLFLKKSSCSNNTVSSFIKKYISESTSIRVNQIYVWKGGNGFWNSFLLF